MPQRVYIKAFSPVQQHSLVVVMRLCRLLLEEPALNRCQLYPALGILLAGDLTVGTQQRTE
ncbi:hypothetical protein D1872_216890 [compost metagenome]